MIEHTEQPIANTCSHLDYERKTSSNNYTMANVIAKSSCDGFLTTRIRVYNRRATIISASAGNTVTNARICGPLLAARYSAVGAGSARGADISIASQERVGLRCMIPQALSHKSWI
jgi:hypothetical protein